MFIFVEKRDMGIIEEIKEERKKQDQKWGEQTHPCLDQTLLNREDLI